VKALVGDSNSRERNNTASEKWFHIVKTKARAGTPVPQ
jgi:hypothetical protein